MKINTTKTFHLQSLVSKIRETFGDKELFLTFFLSGKYVQPGTEVSTFASDNIKHLNNWLFLIGAKFQSKSVESISIVVRRFLKGENNKVEITTPNGKKIKIPKKEIYHFFAMKDFIGFFNQKETLEMQNTNHSTRELMEGEDGTICMSSDDLYNELFNKKFDVDRILEKISKTGEENLTKGEKEFLKLSSEKK